MKLPRLRLPHLSWWQLVLVLVALILVIPGGIVVAVKVVNAIRGRRAVFDAVRLAALRNFELTRPDLSDAQRDRAASIVAAQAVVETGGGVTVAWREGYNFGNVTAGSSWTGEVVQGGDTEPDASGVYQPIVQRFRKYASLDDAMSDFVRVLAWPRYQRARDALFAGDPTAYAKWLRDDDPATTQREGGYYTAPAADYTAGILSALKLGGIA